MNDFLTLKGGEVDVGGAPEVISVLPFGHVVSQKGEFDVDEESLAAMKEQIAQRGVDLVVDYEHQTLTGERAPAAGWVKELFAEDGHIKARVEWTIPAKQYLENKEYRYLSPVITVRKSDNKATGLHSLALTNTPAIAGMTPIVNSSTFQGGETNMNELIKKLAAALGLGEDADEVKKKVMSMYTDPNHLRVQDPGKVEGNPVFIYLDAFSRPEHFAEFLPEYQNLDELKAHYQRGGLGDVKIKKFLNAVMQAELEPIRNRRKEWEQRLPEVVEILKEGSAVAEKTAAATLANVRKAMRIDYFADNNLLK